MRILVTGAAGFIGYWLIKRLVSEDHVVVGVDNVNAYYDVRLKQDRLERLRSHRSFAFHQMDLAQGAALKALVETFRPEVIVHLAAQAGVRYSLDNPRAYTASNIDGFLSVLEACRAFRIEHLLYASSSSVYGGNTKVPFAETDPVLLPVSLYAATKRANELMAQAYSHLFDIRATGLRFFTVYGPWGRPDMAYYKFTKAIFEDKPIDVYNQGAMERDFTYVDEVIEAIARLIPLAPADRDPSGAEPGRLTADCPHRIFNVGNHTPEKLGHFIDVLEGLIGRKAQRRMLPMQPGDVERTCADVSALRAAVGFAPTTPIEVGLERFVKWYRGYAMR